MARNEEKQLARLNRWYLQKQRDEEAIKRPPRPKLDTLNTAEAVKKWIPTITRDIDFYIKQMEVPCYPEHVITEFDRRIDGLKGEYKAFLRKLRQLCPEETSIPWADRPYSGKKRKFTDATEKSVPDTSHGYPNEQIQQSFIPLKTPVLDNDKDVGCFYAYTTTAIPPSLHCDIDVEHRNQPLEFLPIQKENQMTRKAKPVTDSTMSKVEISIEKDSSPVSLNNSLSADEIKAEERVSIKSNENGVMVSDKPPSCIVNSSDSSTVNPHKVKDTDKSPTMYKTKTAEPLPSLNLPYSDSSSDDSDEIT